MKKICLSVANVLKKIFGYGITACLLIGGLTFFGYLAALIIGGDGAVMICRVIYHNIIPSLIYAATILVLIGLAVMYLTGEKALTADKEEASHFEGEI